MKTLKRTIYRLQIKLLLIVLSFTITTSSWGQKKSSIQFTPTFNESALSQGNNYYSYKKDSLCIDVFRMYISNIRFYKNGKPVNQDIFNCFLLDIKKPQSLEIDFNYLSSQPDSLSFTFGTDSLSNVSGAFGGDLDPTLGMYWAWNSGYVNFKLEGSHPLSNGSNHKFEYHIGGYLPPYSTAKNIGFKLSQKQNHNIQIDLLAFISSLDLANQHHIMSPGSEAKELASIIANTFILK